MSYIEERELEKERERENEMVRQSNRGEGRGGVMVLVECYSVRVTSPSRWRGGREEQGLKTNRP